MDNTAVITNSLEFFDKNNEIYKDLYKHVKYIKVKPSENDIDPYIIMFYDQDKNIIFQSRYEVLGLYVMETGTWEWAWTIPRLNKNQTTISRRIWMYGSTLDITDSFLKTELITSRFRITNPIQIEIHISIASYLSKIPLIYRYYSYENPKFEEGLRIETNDKYISVYYLFLLDYKDIDQYMNGIEKDKCDISDISDISDTSSSTKLTQ